MRPANIITAFADILAGIAVAGITNTIDVLTFTSGIGWLLFSTLGLYGGGVVLNDVFDADLDAKERPERAIPSGRVSKSGATLLGAGLLALGIFAAYQVNFLSFIVAVIIAAFAVIYDIWAKHSVIFGPVFMGICRGGNLLLGCSIAPAVATQFAYLALIPIIYIASITLISQGEVHGGKKTSGFFALALIMMVVFSFIGLGFLYDYSILDATAFIIVFVVAVLPPFFRAAQHPSPYLIKKAIKRGVLSQIILDSIIAAGFGGIGLGIITLILLPLSMLIGKYFSVT